MYFTTRPGRVNVCDAVTENIFIGGIESAKTRWKEFDLIVNCTRDIPFPKEDPPDPHHRHPECIRIAVNDDPDEWANMVNEITMTNVLQRIHHYVEQDKRVLVHCYAGIQRSCAVVACYLVQYYEVTPRVAMDHIIKYRPTAFFGGANFLQAIQRQYTMMRFRTFPGDNGW
jgi:hypothetical protein